jgi:hypothetical protein
MGSEASTAKARTADGAKKKALQNPKQQQTLARQPQQHVLHET